MNIAESFKKRGYIWPTADNCHINLQELPNRLLLSVADTLPRGMGGRVEGWLGESKLNDFGNGKNGPLSPLGVGGGGWGFPGCWVCCGPRIDKGTQGKMREGAATKPSTHGDHGAVLSGNADSSVEMDSSSSS